jgi:hypothetical protein
VSAENCAVKQMHNHTLEFGDGLALGPPLSEQDWQQTLERHRKVHIEKLRAIFRKEIVVTKEQRTEIENAAHALWKF